MLPMMMSSLPTLSTLPPEIRYEIYTHLFSDRTFRPLPINLTSTSYPPSSLSELFNLLDYTRTHWLSNTLSYSTITLSDAYLISKSISSDPFLTQAILRTAIFHLDDTSDLERLRFRFGNDVLAENVSKISLSAYLATDDEAITQLVVSMPKLQHIKVKGSLTPLYRVWDLRLNGFEWHPWARFTACLCVFSPAGVPGIASKLTELVLQRQVRLSVGFDWEDPDFGERRMIFDSDDWVLRWERAGREERVNQVRFEELESVLNGGKGREEKIFGLGVGVRPG